MILDKPIVAIDFDGTITIGDNRIWNNNSYTNDTMTPRMEIVNWILQNQDKIYIILWSCRCGKALQDAVDFCINLGIRLDAVNCNIVSYECSCKVMADIYIDDKAINLEGICLQKIF